MRLPLASRVGAAAASWSRRIFRWTPSGLCLNFTRTAQGAPGGVPRAIDSWRGVPLELRHGGKFPPPGVAVFWQGHPGSPGHVAVSLGGGRVRSTDWPSPGTVSSVSIGAVTRRWYSSPGERYLGWGESTNGVRTYIPPRLVLDGSAVRHALREHRSVKVKGGRRLKREIGAVVGKGGMSYLTNRLGRTARVQALKLEAHYHGAHGNGALSDADLRRLGYTRNAFRVHH